MRARAKCSQNTGKQHWWCRRSKDYFLRIKSEITQRIQDSVCGHADTACTRSQQATARTWMIFSTLFESGSCGLICNLFILNSSFRYKQCVMVWYTDVLPLCAWARDGKYPCLSASTWRSVLFQSMPHTDCFTRKICANTGLTADKKKKKKVINGYSVKKTLPKYCRTMFSHLHSFFGSEPCRSCTSSSPSSTASIPPSHSFPSLHHSNSRLSALSVSFCQQAVSKSSVGDVSTMALWR